MQILNNVCGWFVRNYILILAAIGIIVICLGFCNFRRSAADKTVED